MRKPQPDDVSYVDLEKNQKLVSDNTLTKDELRLYQFLTSVMDMDNYIDWTQAEIATAFQITPVAVKRAIDGLIRRRVILKVIEAGQQRLYINPEYAWRRFELRKVN